MIVVPYSRRLRFFGTFTALVVFALFLHIQPSWRQRSYDYALDFSDALSGYLGSDHVYNNTLYQDSNAASVVRYHNFSSPCDNFPDTDGILLVMKTGATEAFDKMPTQLLSSLQCIPDFLLFSDMEQQIGKYHLYDVLAEVEETAKAHNEDFDLYRQQKECPVSQKACVDARAEGQKAWNLDKYKFLPMMEQTWRMRPGRDWYVFAEADTYVFWSNMVHWLRKQSHLSPRQRIYLGSESFVGDHPFGHGGSGYVLSGTLLRHLIENHPGVVKQYNLKGPEECCGDLLLALAIHEYENVKVRQLWPMFNGEKPSTLPFGPGHWCEPILTMHHMNAEEISSVWQFEQTRKTDRTIMIKDIYDALVAPKMQVRRNNWDNLSDDICYINPDPGAQEGIDNAYKEHQKKESEMSSTEKEAWKSPENCARVCEDEDVYEEETSPETSGAVSRRAEFSDDVLVVAPDTQSAMDSGPSDATAREQRHHAMNQKKKDRTCFQWRWHDEICCTARSFKLGAPKAKPNNDKSSPERWVSGWDLKGINDWIGAMGECTPKWKKVP